ncbi:MAG: penicillin-binding protein activator [Alphaproteobacteria bacterium]|nr:penicillin-binding protein activator [Alphaproteobacteria bacterium]
MARCVNYLRHMGKVRFWLMLVFALLGFGVCHVGQKAVAADFFSPSSNNDAGKSGNKTSHKYRVALLVPLSGPDATMGKALLHAAQMALFDFTDAQFVLIPIDTEKAGGAKAAAKKALDAKASLVIGPVFSKQATEVADAVSRANINVITLSNDTAIAGGNLFVFGLAPSQILERVLTYAATKNITRFAALFPDDALGQRLSGQLRLLSSALGGQVMRIEQYPSQTKDFSDAVKRVAEFDARRMTAAEIAAAQEAAKAAAQASTDPNAQNTDKKPEKLTARQKDAQKRAEKLLTSRQVDYDALVISESGQRLRNLASLIPYYNIDVMQTRILGASSLWDDPILAKEPGLVGGWFAATDPAGRRNFEERFSKNFHYAPPRITSLVYDAVGLAALMARKADKNNESDAFPANGLRSPGGFSGIDGIFRFTSTNTSERGLAVFEIDARRGAVMIDRAPTSFATSP